MTVTNLKPIKRLLIANRGEIACRIMRTAQRMGIHCIAVYSDVDANALHVKQADEAHSIGPAASAQSYLNQQAILNVASVANADAIHPGYGFLSERPEFAEACAKQGVIFVGPSAAAIKAMGLKDAAKELMHKAGVPVVPGYHGKQQDAAFLEQQADHIAYPVLIKARAGGGGKGMRKVDSANEFNASLLSAQREAEASFSDGAVLLEKYIDHPRHIEVQVFGDTHGNIVHLFERDCSLQRRHQKVLEEAPAPGISDALRDAMTDAAVRAAKAIDYCGAGTVEFIVDASDTDSPTGFWFMEMNTRLQVEHPVTEFVTGYDLVEWQLRVASGEPLPVAQNDIALKGHAVEARLYAEDPNNDFLPSTGMLQRFYLHDAVSPLEGRIDAGVEQGEQVQPYYDPMLAKLIVYGPDRSHAFAQLARQLEHSTVLGVKTNRAFLARLAQSTAVLQGHVNTHFIAQHSQELLKAPESMGLLKALAAIAVSHHKHPHGVVASSAFTSLGLWQLWGAPQRRYTLMLNTDSQEYSVTRLAPTVWSVDSTAHKGFPIELEISDVASLASGTSVLHQQRLYQATALVRGMAVDVQLAGEQQMFGLPERLVSSSAELDSSQLKAPMPGRVVAVHCEVGQVVEKGEPLLSMEAMKMEQTLNAGISGVIRAVYVGVDQQVEQGAIMVQFSQPE